METALNSNVALQILIQISDALQYNDEDSLESIQKICEHFKREKQSAVRVRILALLSEFAAEPCSVDGSLLVDEIIQLLKTEQSPKVSEIYNKKKKHKSITKIVSQ